LDVVGLQKLQQQLKEREASLEQKEESLRAWQKELDQRDNARHNQDNNNQVQHDDEPPRRRLFEQGPKIVPTGFLRDFQAWNSLVLSNVEKDLSETKMFVLDGLIEHGHHLLEQWDLNHFDDPPQSEALKGLVTKKEIQDIVEKLRERLHDARLFNHDHPQGSKDQRPGDPDVKKRYGKWQSVLSNNTELAHYFYQEGAKGLELFGYHPYREIQYYDLDSAAKSFNSSAGKDGTIGADGFNSNFTKCQANRFCPGLGS